MSVAQLPRCKLTGVCAPARAAVLATLLRDRPAPVWLVIAEEPRTAGQIAEDLLFFRGLTADAAPLDVRIFPESLADSRDQREAFTASSDRLTVLSSLRAARETTDAARASVLVVVATPAALLQPVPALAALVAQEITVARGGRPGFQALVAQLRAFDYDGEAVCEAPGQYAVRGGILDVYPVTATQPCRLDFLGDEI